MSLQEHALPPNCPNCGAPVHGPFCAHCGQKVQIETPTLFEFIHEYLHHYVALDGTLTRTLWLLLSAPGKLTTEFIAGRRARYVKPFQLYLTISFIFFIALASISGHINVKPGPGGKEIVQLDPGDDLQKPPITLKGNTYPWAEKLVDHVNKRAAEFNAHPSESWRTLQHDMLGVLPYGVFILMPIYALFLKLAFWRRHMNYGVHLVFTLHVHALVFLVFLALMLLGAYAGWLLLGIALYILLALRRVYGGSWPTLVLRAAVLGALYGVSIVLVLGLLLAVVFLA